MRVVAKKNVTRKVCGYYAICTRCRNTQFQEGKTKEELVDHTKTGETARSVYTRSKQHLSDYRSHTQGQKAVARWMWNHTLSHHGGVVGPDQGSGDYIFRIQGRFDKPLQQQVDEAVRLGQIDPFGKVVGDKEAGGRVVSQNTRGEYYTPKIVQYMFEN